MSTARNNLQNVHHVIDAEYAAKATKGKQQVLDDLNLEWNTESMCLTRNRPLSDATKSTYGKHYSYLRYFF
ncbi:MAG: hypothetical protein ACREBR_00800 [bacterium]